MQSATITQNIGRATKSIDLSIIAFGSARLTIPELSAIRKESLGGFPANLSPQFLRHSDEQTLAALAAISTAMRQSLATNMDYGNWAIVSSSRNLGRGAFAGVIDKYRSEGPWGVSVQVIPHCTTHAVAGTISLALGSHGPCIGAGDGPASESEALLSAASILRQNNCGGAWILFSGWSPELSIDSAGQPNSDSACFATAIAAVRHTSRQSPGQIRIDLHPHWIESLDYHPSPVSLTEYFADTSRDRNSWHSPASSAIRICVELFGDEQHETSDAHSNGRSISIGQSRHGRKLFSGGAATPTKEA